MKRRFGVNADESLSRALILTIGLGSTEIYLGLSNEGLIALALGVDKDHHSLIIASSQMLSTCFLASGSFSASGNAAWISFTSVDSGRQYPADLTSGASKSCLRMEGSIRSDRTARDTACSK